MAIPNTFVNGTLADGDEVNENFVFAESGGSFGVIGILGVPLFAQTGSVSAGTSSSTVVTFTVPFSTTPVVTLGPTNSFGINNSTAFVQNINAGSFTYTNADASESHTANWMAMGPQ